MLVQPLIIALAIILAYKIYTLSPNKRRRWINNNLKRLLVITTIAALIFKPTIITWLALAGLGLYIFVKHKRKKSSVARHVNMDVQHALMVMGLDELPNELDIINRQHKRMMAKHHPDKGGSHAKASQINQARDVLVRAFHSSS